MRARGWHHAVTDEMVERMVAMRRSGMTVPQIARETGFHENTVRKHIERVLKEEHTPTKTEVAREMFRRGSTIQQVCSKVGITVGAAKRIQRDVLGPRRPSDESTAIAVWRLFEKGWEPSEIDRHLGIDCAHDVIVYEWLADKGKKPSLVGSGI